MRPGRQTPLSVASLLVLLLVAPTPARGEDAIPSPAPTVSPAPDPTASPSPSPTPSDAPSPSPLLTPTPTPTPTPSPVLTPGPTPTPISSPIPTPSPSPLAGLATWYWGTRGWGDVAHVALPPALGGRYRVRSGKLVPRVRICVTATGRCADLPVVDNCACPTRIADLSSGALEALSLRASVGVYGVTVSRLSPASYPPPVSASPAPIGASHVVACAGVRLRQGPGTRYRTSSVLRVGTRVTIGGVAEGGIYRDACAGTTDRRWAKVIAVGGVALRAPRYVALAYLR